MLKKMVLAADSGGIRASGDPAVLSRAGNRKLLIATDNFLPRWDGISRFLAEIIPRLRVKYDITVIAPDNGPSPADSATTYRLIKMPLSKRSIGDFTLAKPANKLIRDEIMKCDLVFSQTIGPIGMRCIRIARQERKKVVSFIHSIEWELATRAIGIRILKGSLFALARGIVKRTYNKVDLLMVPASSISEMLSWHNIRTEKRVIHLGVDTKRFVPPDKKDDAKRKIGIDHAALVLGFTGRLGREKDLMTLLRAFIIVRKAYPFAILLVVGDGLESIKKKLAGVKGVILPGSTNNVVPYLQAMDIFCLTSLTETTSLATLEAMACGVPVISNKVGFVKDYIRPQKNGLFFKGGDSYDLAKQISHLAANDDLRKKISSAARKFVEKEFGWDNTARKIDETIMEMLSMQNQPNNPKKKN